MPGEQVLETPVLHRTPLIPNPCSLCPQNCSRNRRSLAQKLPDVLDAVPEHGHALGAHAEGKAGELERIVTSVAQHSRMDHAAAEDLQPAGALADGASLPGAQEALDVHLGGGFGEGKVAGRKRVRTFSPNIRRA